MHHEDLTMKAKPRLQIIVLDLSCSDDQSDYICQKAATTQPVRDTGSPYLIPEPQASHIILKNSLRPYHRRYLLDLLTLNNLRLLIYIYYKWGSCLIFYMSRECLRQTIVFFLFIN